MSEPQRALLSYISAGQEVITRAEEELLTKVIDFFSCFIHFRFLFYLLINKFQSQNYRPPFKILVVIFIRYNGVKIHWVHQNKPLLCILLV